MLPSLTNSNLQVRGARHSPKFLEGMQGHNIQERSMCHSPRAVAMYNLGSPRFDLHDSINMPEIDRSWYQVYGRTDPWRLPWLIRLGRHQCTSDLLGRTPILAAFWAKNSTTWHQDAWLAQQGWHGQVWVCLHLHIHVCKHYAGAARCFFFGCGWCC